MEEDKDQNLDVTVEKSDDGTSVTITAPDGDAAAVAAPPAPPAPPGAPAVPEVPAIAGGKGKLRISVDGKDVQLGAEEATRSETGEDVHVSVDSPDHLQIIAGLGGAVLMLFTIIVLPIWIISHYRSKQPRPVPNRNAVAANIDLSRLDAVAERLERRMDAMEALMDAENPNWRK